jgi:hypothetical protein
MAHSITLNKQYGTDSEVNLNSSPNITSHTPEIYDIRLILMKCRNCDIIFIISLAIAKSYYVIPHFVIIGMYVIRNKCIVNRLSN